MLTDTFHIDLCYQARKAANTNSISENRSMVICVVEIVPVRVVEIVPVRVLPLTVVEIVPVLVVEIVPDLVVEIVPDFPKAAAETAQSNSVAQMTDLMFFITLLLRFQVKVHGSALVSVTSPSKPTRKVDSI